jgi:succinate-semialdehyde dehydrogenase/glutarate-semialdehyde dehydrogenase
MSSIQSINPATGAVLATFEALDEGALEERLNRAVAAFASWKKTSFKERAALMTHAADLLERDADEIARIMALEMGKPLRDARGEAL